MRSFSLRVFLVFVLSVGMLFPPAIHAGDEKPKDPPPPPPPVVAGPPEQPAILPKTVEFQIPEMSGRMAARLEKLQSLAGEEKIEFIKQLMSEEGLDFAALQQEFTKVLQGQLSDKAKELKLEAASSETVEIKKEKLFSAALFFAMAGESKKSSELLKDLELGFKESGDNVFATLMNVQQMLMEGDLPLAIQTLNLIKASLSSSEGTDDFIYNFVSNQLDYIQHLIHGLQTKELLSFAYHAANQKVEKRFQLNNGLILKNTSNLEFSEFEYLTEVQLIEELLAEVAEAPLQVWAGVL